MSDNGKEESAQPSVQPPPTAEELAINKRKAFEANPNDFIYVNDIVVAAIIGPNGNMGVVTNTKRGRSLIHQALGMIPYEVYRVLDYIEFKKMEAAKSKLVKTGGIMNFVRGKK